MVVSSWRRFTRISVVSKGNAADPYTHLIKKFRRLFFLRTSRILEYTL